MVTRKRLVPYWKYTSEAGENSGKEVDNPNIRRFDVRAVDTIPLTAGAIGLGQNRGYTSWKITLAGVVQW